ncbi:hypothetical protein ACWFRJ_43620 [Streptomyces sp. NPDC055239]
MAEMLTWVMQRRMALEARAEQLSQELVDIEAEAAEAVIAQFIEANLAGAEDDPALGAELEHVTTAPGAGGMLLVPQLLVWSVRASPRCAPGPTLARSTAVSTTPSRKSESGQG